MVVKAATLLSTVLGFSFMGALVSVLPSLAAADLQTIQQRGRLIVAVKNDVRPLGFRGADGQLQGLEIEIAQRLAQELLGRKDAVEWQSVVNQDRLTAVIDGKADIAIAHVTGTPLRARLVSLSVPYYLDGTALITRDTSVQRLADIGKGSIAVLDGSSAIATLRYRLPDANLISVASYEAAHALLEKGDAIAFAGDATVLAGWVHEFPSYRLLTPTLSAEPLCIVMPKGLQYTDLHTRINQIIARWIAEGWLQERATYWGLP
ncbi:MAG: transporter substrate-binding domain-containing protein [Stenomitos rutilans HA7619-LM2]|jgi:polar amino acid transport system substrate-binding protein|nr:transporter substrate-binding domain-containing protein [Stenomitos rutilans HA7619-LM2]